MPAMLTTEQKRRASLQIAKLRKEGIEKDVAVAKAMDMARRDDLDADGKYRRVEGASS